MLIGILGDKALSDYGYPDPHTSGSIHILHRILDKARVEVILKVISLQFKSSFGSVTDCRGKLPLPREL